MKSGLEYKRNILAEVLSGNFEGLRDYRDQQTVVEMHFRQVIDARAVGGTIILLDSQGGNRVLTVEEFEALPVQARKQSTVTVVDTTGGYRVPEPDEDYFSSTESKQYVDEDDNFNNED